MFMIKLSMNEEGKKYINDAPGNLELEIILKFNIKC